MQLFDQIIITLATEHAFLPSFLQDTRRIDLHDITLLRSPFQRPVGYAPNIQKYDYIQKYIYVPAAIRGMVLSYLVGVIF